MALKHKDKRIIGWREWVSLPQLGIGHIKAKIDTGARTSSLHAYDIHYITRGGCTKVKFIVHPIQRNSRIVNEAIADLVDERIVRSSSGHEEQRPVIRTMIRIMDWEWPIEITLTRRDVMGFRMLLGRQAIRGKFLVNAGRSYLGGKPKRKKVKSK